MGAASEGRTDAVQALLAKGADENAKRDDGGTALMTAKKKGHKEIVQLLKKAGAKE
jgi:ankyrin repeat protein